MHQNYRKFQSQNVQIDWYVLHDTRGQNHSQTLKIQWFFFCEICTDTHLQASCGKDNLRTFCWDLDGRKYRTGNVYLCIVSKVYSCQLTWMISKWLERSTISIPRWRNWWNTLIWENLHRFLIMCTWVALNVNANPRKYGWRNANPINVNVRVANLCWCNWKKLLESKNGAHGNSWSYDMEGHARKCIERYCELANETIGQMQQVSTPCFDDHQFRKEELATVDELSKVCSPNRPEMLLFGTYWWSDILARAVTKCKSMWQNAWLASLRTCTTRVITCNTRMWEIRHSIVDWNCLRVLILFKIDPGRVLCIFGSRKLVPLK